MARLMFAAAVALAAIAAPIAHAQEKKPNFIVILTDDVGYAEYGFQGCKDIPTPNIDSIAKNGVRFTQGYVAATYCSPSRAGLLTGRYPTRFGHEFNGGGGAGGKGFGLPVNQTTLATRLKSLGYATSCVGKWHLGHGPEYMATARGFDEFYGTVANTPFYNPPNFIDSRKSPDIAPVKDDSFYTTDAYGDRAADWIGKQKGKPFFLYLPFNAQHAPLQAPKKYLDRFPNIADEKRKLFAAMMSAKDDAVGKALAKVKEIGAEENTLIFFLSDNGGPTEVTTSKNDPLRGFKSTTLEGGVRVPFCVQWKGKLPAGTVYEHPVINLDIFATVLTAAVNAARAQPDAPQHPTDGVDLVPYLTGKIKERPHETLYWRFGDQWAIRKGDFKLVASRIDGVQNVKLYDLKDDIGEAKDLAATMPDKVKELRADWDQWNKDNIPPRWVPVKKKKGKGKS